jgi:hypothetical protein
MDSARQSKGEKETRERSYAQHRLTSVPERLERNFLSDNRACAQEERAGLSLYPKDVGSKWSNLSPPRASRMLL